MTEATFHDELVASGAADTPAQFFDRFMFNAHPTDATSPSIIVGAGKYPDSGTVDGFAIVTMADEQRNHRFSTELGATGDSRVGPLSWSVLKPLEVWRVVLDTNPTGLTFDLTWRARTPAWFGPVAVANSGTPTTSFDHLFQSGSYTGSLTLDGDDVDVEGWYGQRDRSRGVRTMAGGQGLHLWFQAQFPDRAVGFLLVETRDGDRLLLEGAVMHTHGGLDPVADVRHALVFDDHLDLRSGTVEVVTAAGTTYRIDADASAGGGFMAGGGYGGHHGRAQGRDHAEHDVYPLDGSVSPMTLDSALTDRLSAFTWDGTTGVGIFEFALTRSRSYRYPPTLTS
jgi:hypothetical protein